MPPEPANANSLAKHLESSHDTQEKLSVLVELLRVQRSSSEWLGTLARVPEIVTPAEFAVSLAVLAAIKSDCAKMIASVILEKAGRFADAAELLAEFSFGPTVELEVLRLQALARNNSLAGRSTESVLPLRRAIRMTESNRSLTASARILKMLGSVGAQSCQRSLRMAVLGNATFDLLLPQLKVMAFSYGIDVEIYAGAYNQHAQELLSADSTLRAFNPDLVVIATNTSSLPFPEETEDWEALLSDAVREITSLWSSCLKSFSCTVIQHNFVVPEISPFGRLSNSLPGGRTRLIRKLNEELETAASNAPGVVILDVEQIASVLGKRAWEDHRMWIQAKQYPSASGIVPLVRHQIAVARSVLGLASKCVVLDLDNTLWGGVIGEDGLNGIELGGSSKGEAYASFQQYLLGLHNRGILLAVCSKNNEADATQPFDAHPEMRLKREHIAAFAANWLPKPENLRAIARQLNIGLESLVFVDDNPIERELVRTELPQVEVPEMPEDPSLFAATLHRELLFESVSLSSEDRQRSELYRANSQRQALESDSSSLEGFLFGLRMEAKLRSFDSANEPRIVQLINKTNQFNLTTQRMSQSEVRAYASHRQNYTQFLDLTDRFGCNGIVGVLMASPIGNSLKIDQWLMSCRVLGRRVEDVMISAVWNYARSHGYKKLIGEFRPTAKNVQVAELYEQKGFILINESASGTRVYEAELDKRFPAPEFFSIDDKAGELAAEVGH